MPQKDKRKKKTEKKILVEEEDLFKDLGNSGMATKHTSPKKILLSDDENVGAFTECFRTSAAEAFDGLGYLQDVFDQPIPDANDKVSLFQKELAQMPDLPK